jgi:hypothetical protein
MKNIYDGVVIVGANGEATVTLPQWFEALNHQLRYQLTPLGESAPGLHVAREVTGNQFTIAGARAGMRVSWQITGVRRDAWANAHRIVVEDKKRDKERDHYLHPQLHDGSDGEGIGELLHPRPKRA